MAKKPRLGELLRLTAVPFWFDEELVTALRAQDDGQTANVLALLDQFSFVHTGYGRYWYSSEMRQSLLEQWADDPDGLAAAHRRALETFERRLADSPPGDLAAREEMAAAHLYHLLAVDQRAGIERLLDLFDDASDEHRVASAAKYVRVAEEQAATLSAESRAHLDYLRGRLLQLQHRWPESRAHLERLLESKGLPQVLRARTRRSVADALVALGQAADALPLYEQALAEFETLGDRQEIGLTMAGLGNAYLSVALAVWGSGWMQRPPPRSWLNSLLGLGHLLVRIPLVLYLLWHVGARTLLPVAQRVGRGMDWIVARVLVTAGDWFHRAELTLEAANTPAGLVEVHRGLAELYRLLDHPQRAEALNREILEMDTVPADGYQAACARLGIAYSLLLQGKAGASAEILEELLPIFRRFEHGRRIAQTLTLLAEATLQLNRPDEAIRYHQEALSQWQAVDDLAAATEALQAMEKIKNQYALSIESQRRVEQASRQCTERVYAVPYSHPMLIAFSRVALVVLVVLFFFTVRLALRSESGIEVDATASLVKPLLREIPTDEELRPDVILTIDQQLRPSPPMEFAGLLVVASLVGYLLLYTIVGWLVIITTPIDAVRPGAVRAVLVSPEEIRLLTPEGDGESMTWSEVSVMLRSDRIVAGQPLQAFSFFALFSGTGSVSVSARTQNYVALRELVTGYIKSASEHRVQTYDLGFRMIGSKTGGLFLASLVYLLGFFVVAVLWPDLVTQNYAPIPYNAVDVYWLAYLGLALPLSWWFAIQPLRAHWLVSVRTPIVWLVGGTGLALALVSLLQIFGLHLPLGRPDVIAAVLAILLVGAAGGHVLRARATVISAGSREYAYPPLLRVAAAVITSVTVAAMLLAIGWELISYHHLAMGNNHLRAAEELKQKGQEQPSKEAYREALESYADSLWYRPEAYVYNSQGAVLTRLGRYPDALKAYRKAQEADPGEPTYIINEALLYESQASSIERPDATFYEKAIACLDKAIEQIAVRPEHYKAQLLTAYQLRGGAYYERGQIYFNMSREVKNEAAMVAAELHATAMSSFTYALDDYNWLATHDPDGAPGYTGRGWAYFQLRKMVAAGDAGATEQSRSYLQLAIDEFEEALHRNDKEISAKIGLGWAHNFYAQSYPACMEAQDPKGSKEYRRHLQAAVRAYTLVTKQERAAIHYRVRAQFEYLLRFCDGLSPQAQYEQARNDYDRAIGLREEQAVTQEDLSASWYNIRGNLSYVLAGIYTDTRKVQETQFRALDDYRRATEIQPQVLDWWHDLAWVAYDWQDDGQWHVAIEGFRGIAALSPNPEEAEAYGRLGWLAYLYTRDYAQSLEYSAKALALDHDLSAEHFNEGLIYVVLGDVEAAVQSYLNGIEAADRVGTRRKRRYDGAIADLDPGNIQGDPAGVAASFSELLQAAKGKQACTVTVEAARCRLIRKQPSLAEAAPCLLVREQPDLGAPLLNVLWAGDNFLPAARSAQGNWLYGVIKGQEVFGWINGDPSLLSCSFDLSALPVVDDPARLRPP
jgi:tetratricopeptide (TPR) repeat protein